MAAGVGIEKKMISTDDPPERDARSPREPRTANSSTGYLILKLRVVASTVPHKRSLPSDTL